MSEGLTVDDLNRLAEKVADVAEEHLFDGDHDAPLDGYDDLYDVHRCLLAAAREVEGLRAEVERLREQMVGWMNRFGNQMDTATKLIAERDAAVARADTAERRLAAVEAELTDWENASNSDGSQPVMPVIGAAKIMRSVLAAAGPVPVTPVTEDQQ